MSQINSIITEAALTVAEQRAERFIERARINKERPAELTWRTFRSKLLGEIVACFPVQLWIKGNDAYPTKPDGGGTRVCCVLDSLFNSLKKVNVQCVETAPGTLAPLKDAKAFTAFAMRLVFGNNQPNQPNQ